jgi:putative transposase
MPFFGWSGDYRRGPWRSFDTLAFATLTWFDNRWLLEPICDIPPVEAEERCYARIDEKQMAV